MAPRFFVSRAGYLLGNEEIKLNTAMQPCFDAAQ
jgi:hypothetical protein